MFTPNAPNRVALRAFVVIALSVLMIGLFAMDLRRIWSPLGVFGHDTNGDGVVVGVDANSPAAKAGIQVGDRVDESSTAPQFKPYVIMYNYVWAPGQNATFALIHRSTRRTVTLTATPERVDNLRKVFKILDFVAAVFVTLIGAALVLLRPSIMTWGFFFYCLLFTPGTSTCAFALSFPASYVIYAFFNLISAAGIVGLLVFAFYFLSQPVSRWRLSALRLMPWLFFVLVVFFSWNDYQMFWIGGPPGEMGLRIAVFWLNALAVVVALYAFVDTYVRARGTDRQRIRWVIVGFSVSLVATYVGNISANYSLSTPIWVQDALYLCTVIVPLTIAYAIVKHHIIDVSFVLNRALVYGVITTLLVGAFALVDWLFIDKLKLARLGTIAEMGVAVAGGFWFNGLHRRVDSLIDATFFRQRHKAERQLARVAAALPLATTAGAVANCLVNEPVRAMSLASAALFRRGRDGVYTREQSEGWDTSNLTRLDDTDETLLMLAQAEGGPLSLYDHPWRTQGKPSGPAHPVLALPIVVRRELTAIVFYGSHVHGEALDPDEIKAIAVLAPGAAVAYDHLEAESLRRELEAVKRESESRQRESESLRFALQSHGLRPT